MSRRWPVVVAALAVAVLLGGLASVAVLLRPGDDGAAGGAVGTRAIGGPAEPTGDWRVGAPPASPLAPLTTVPAPTTTTIPPVPLVDAVAFVGDSLAENLAGGLTTTTATGRPLALPVLDDSISGCGVARSGSYRLSGWTYVLSPTCAAWSDTWSERLRRDRPKVVAVQLGRHEVLDRLHEGRWTNILDPAYRAYVRRELQLAIRIAREDGATVALLTAPRFQRPERPGGGQWPENDPGRVDRFNDLLRELAALDPKVTVVDLAARTSPGATYVGVVEGVTVRSDGVHYSQAGVAWIGPWLLSQLSALL